MRFAGWLAAELLRVTPRPWRPWRLCVRHSGADPAASSCAHAARLGHACRAPFASLGHAPGKGGAAVPRALARKLRRRGGSGVKVTPPLPVEAPGLTPIPSGVPRFGPESRGAAGSAAPSSACPAPTLPIRLESSSPHSPWHPAGGRSPPALGYLVLRSCDGHDRPRRPTAVLGSASGPRASAQPSQHHLRPGMPVWSRDEDVMSPRGSPLPPLPTAAWPACLPPGAQAPTPSL